jgi:hypoxanthine phosphoribosyltransferase
MIEGRVLRPLFSKEQIHDQVLKLASLIEADFPNERLLFICLLKGSFMFTSDLIRHVNNPCVVDFMRVSSYGNRTTTSGTINISKDIETSIAGQNVVIVEDIIDSGITLSHVRDMLLKRNPKALKICALVDKRARRQVVIEGDYVGFTLDDGFIVGYGIDYGEEFRNLPDIHVID